ncbi:excalibur calcium-binding domain-containing protein [Niallia sp. 03133]|uniref:excalibur calcium-binding domain-containing protein n=1 Tax=Niallia sp. 03133 TaxID=3458060 RepID=UPI0040443121
MKQLISLFASVCIIVTLSFISTGNAEAKSKIKEYSNCKELNKDYKGGVAKSSSVKNKGGKTKYKPYVSKDLYNSNKKSDRDKDGIACER